MLWHTQADSTWHHGARCQLCHLYSEQLNLAAVDNCNNPPACYHACLLLFIGCRFGIGAIAEGGHVIINEAAVESVGATKQQLQDTIDRETTELQRRVQDYRGGRPHLPVSGTACPCNNHSILQTSTTCRVAASYPVEHQKHAQPGSMFILYSISSSSAAVRS